MMHHINSYSRERLNNKTPHESFSFFYGKKIVDTMGSSPIHLNFPLNEHPFYQLTATGTLTSHQRCTCS
ncbi:MAG: hypothetical protein Q8S19_03870, partial [Bacillota bacterium]|nr:hypothetical protein [Bacillota bacterium]